MGNKLQIFSFRVTVKAKVFPFKNKTKAKELKAGY